MFGNPIGAHLLEKDVPHDVHRGFSLYMWLTLRTAKTFSHLQENLIGSGYFSSGGEVIQSPCHAKTLASSDWKYVGSWKVYL